MGQLVVGSLYKVFSFCSKILFPYSCSFPLRQCQWLVVTSLKLEIFFLRNVLHAYDEIGIIFMDYVCDNSFWKYICSLSVMNPSLCYLPNPDFLILVYSLEK